VLGVAAVLLAAAPAQAQAKRHWLWDRWEAEFEYGFQFNGRYGGADLQCVGAGAVNPISGSTAEDCNAGLNNSLQEQFLGLDATDALSDFQQNASVHYNSGQAAGVRLGFFVTNRVAVEFRYSYGRANLAFDRARYRAALDALRSIDSGAIDPVQLVILDEGRPKGHLKFYQWDVVYHFGDHLQDKLVPYVMGGAGIYRMGNGPAFEILTLDGDGSVSGGGPGTPLIHTVVASDPAGGFSWSFGGGVKYYFGRWVGTRLELRNSFTYPRFHHVFLSETVSDFTNGNPGNPGGPIAPTGTVTQRNNFNSVDFKAGFIFRF
jgi:hypothetical protein